VCDAIDVKLCILIAAVLAAACTSGAEQRQESRATVWQPVASWSGGVGSTTLETFPIGAGRLRVYWDAHTGTPGGGTRFHVRLHSADSGRVLEDVVDTKGVGSGMREVFDDHQRFYLTVESAAVEWTLRVEEGLAARR
jgi:hypothetical protein